MPGYGDPPNRFSATNQPKHYGKRGVSLVAELKRLLEKQINYQDPETKKQVKGKIGRVIALRYILNACQGENQAIEGIMDRIDGKTVQKLLGEGFNNETKIILITPEARKEKENANRIDAIAI